MVAVDPGYSAEHIQVLEGLDPVRARPGMYIGSTGPSGLHHLVWEVVDNSVDEAMAGYCDTIEVVLLADGGVRVADNGRGIPVDPYPSGPHKGKSALEVVLTVLHAGGKFGGGGYKVSGGLHGVGVSVVNALSSRLVAEVWRDGKHWTQEFAVERRRGVVRSGVPQGPVRVAGRAPKRLDGKGWFTGTTITFWPDPDVFRECVPEGGDRPVLSAQMICDRLQKMAFLNRGLTIRFRDERGDEPVEQVFHAENGLVDFVELLNSSKQPLYQGIGYFSGSNDDGEVEVAFQWNTGFNDGLLTFANGITTNEGGTHAEGFKVALTSCLNRYAKTVGLLKDKDPGFTGEDVREGLTAVVSVRLTDPQFEGQTKNKLGNLSMRTLVQSVTTEHMNRWLEEHPKQAKAVVEKVKQAARGRKAAKEAKEAARRQQRAQVEGLGTLGKLRDASSRNPAERELYIVEGDSAAGTAVSARNPRTQAILPIKGKPLNVERAELAKIVKNSEIQGIVAALGGTVGEDLDPDKSRFSKICILSDADVDGHHIRTLLLTFFYRKMPSLVRAGMVYIAETPLYSVEVAGKKVYLRDEHEKERFVAAQKNKNLVFTRMKGLGEMDWPELKEAAFDPATRRLVRIDEDQAALADEIMSILMGDDVEQRKRFIAANASDTRFIDI